MHPHNAMHPLKPKGVHCIKIRVISQKRVRRTPVVRLTLVRISFLLFHQDKLTNFGKKFVNFLFLFPYVTD